MAKNYKGQRMYFNWLINRVSLDDLYGRSYTHLAHVLHGMIFCWNLELDENRSTDGLYLRTEWAELIENESDMQEYPLPFVDTELSLGPCTVFEMMVALAARIENDIMQEDDKGNRTPLWFYYMLQNLDLLDCDDDHVFESTNEYIRNVIRKMLYREYTADGKGSLFPLSGRCEDRREVDIWWQAQHWLAENFPD